MEELREFNKKVGTSKMAFERSTIRENRPTAAKPVTYAPPDHSAPSTEPLIAGGGNVSCWAVTTEGYLACERSVPVLPSGLYSVIVTQSGLMFRKTEINIDDLFNLPDSSSEEVVQEIEKFWNSEKKFRDSGFLWKRGILLWGPPGSGKTSTLQLMIQSIIKKNGIALSICDKCSPEMCSLALSILRRVEPTRPLIGILEDIDSMAATYGESNILSMLDGEHQIDNVVYIATTNYPERLDPRFINRPSRFDVIKKIGMPSAAARKIYLEKKSEYLKKDPKELDKWVKDTDGFSIAHLKELIVAVDVFEVSYKNSIDRLKTMMEISASSQESPKIGFNQ